jgi:hypothetical protein
MTSSTGRGSIDHRKEPRYPVTWRARVTLPSGHIREVRVQDISENGIGLLCEEPVQNRITLSIVLGVPDIEDPARVLAVPVQITVAYVVMNGDLFRVGGTWAGLHVSARDLLNAWIRRLSFQD